MDQEFFMQRVVVDTQRDVLQEKENEFIVCSLKENKDITSNNKSLRREGALK